MAPNGNDIPRAISRRDFARITVASAVAVPLAGVSTAGPVHEIQSPAKDPPPPDLKPHPALTSDQAAKLDESLGRLAGQLAQIRKHPLAYTAEPAFTFHVEIPRRAVPAAIATKG